MLRLDVAITGSMAAHFAADGAGDAADLAGDPDLEAVWVMVAAVSLVDMGAADFDASEPLQLSHDGTVVGVVVQRLGVQHELAALGAGHRRDLAAEFVFDLGRGHRIDFRPALTRLLETHPNGERHQRREALLWGGIARDLAADVADLSARRARLN